MPRKNKTHAVMTMAKSKHIPAMVTFLTGVRRVMGCKSRSSIGIFASIASRFARVMVSPLPRYSLSTRMYPTPRAKARALIPIASLRTRSYPWSGVLSCSRPKLTSAMTLPLLLNALQTTCQSCDRTRCTTRPTPEGCTDVSVIRHQEMKSHL